MVSRIKILDEPGAFYVMDRACVDFERLFVFTLCSSFFVVRTKKHILLQRRYSHPVDKYTAQAIPPCPCSLCFSAVMEASRNARLNLLFDFGAHGAFGDVEIVTGLKIDPELRRRPEIAPQA